MTAKTALWGLTGGIASGKSMAAFFFGEAGIPVIDADQIARELTGRRGKAHAEIVRRFGTADRGKLRDIIFVDAKARKDLEAILHPLIRAETATQVERLAKPIVIYEAALLVETGGYKDLAGLIVVEAPREMRRQRLIERNGFSPELADRILASQISDEERRRAATVVIDNSESLDSLRQKVMALVYERFQATLSPRI